MSDHINPFIIGPGEHYVPSLDAINKVYTQHPDFKATTKLIYELLFGYYNAEYGYAFPTLRKLERDSGLGITTVKRQIKTLQRLGLVEIKRSRYGNNTYVIKKPVQTLEQLYEKFPKIEAKSRERLRKIDKEEAAELDRLKGS